MEILQSLSPSLHILGMQEEQNCNTENHLSEEQMTQVMLNEYIDESNITGFTSITTHALHVIKNSYTKLQTQVETCTLQVQSQSDENKRLRKVLGNICLMTSKEDNPEHIIAQICNMTFDVLNGNEEE